MSNYVDPTKAIIRSVTINGADLTKYAHALSVHETVCKPYITGQAIIHDYDNIVDSMQIVGGEDISVAFTAPPNSKTYSTDNCKVLSIKGEQNPNNLKGYIFTIDFIGNVYFQDRGSMVQSVHKNQTGTDAIQQLFSKFLSGDKLQILSNSIGMIGDKEGYTITNRKPFAAIEDIMKLLVFGGVKTGNVLFFRDAESVKLAPLEHLVQNMSSQEYFIQKETWGVNMFDPDLYHAIIWSELKNERTNSGKSHVGEMAAAVNQNKVTFDFHTAAVKFLSSAAVSGGGSIASKMQSIVKSPNQLGGIPNVQLFRSILWPDATAPHNKTMQEKMYSSAQRGSPHLKIKVPLQTGINVTVGKGIDVTLTPPSVDGSGNPYSYSLNGKWLCTDLVHELVIGSDSSCIGTTTLQNIKGSF